MILTELLRQNSLFSGLAEPALEQLAARLEIRTLAPGEVLFNLGDPGSEMILVERGKIAIYMPQPGHPEAGQAIRVFVDGQTLGEMALIDNLPRSASARAEEETVIRSLSQDDLHDLMAREPGVAGAMMKELSSRLRYSTDFIGELRQWVGALAEGNYQSIQAPAAGYQDRSMSTLAADFVRMAACVREREERLRQEVVQLRIEIDETRRHQEVRKITESDYYQDIKAKLKALREQDDD